MIKVIVVKEFVDASNFAKRYEVGKEASFEDERADYLVKRGLVKIDNQKGTGIPKTAEEVATLAEAKKFLTEKEIVIASNAGKDKVIEVAKENGIEFPNL